jgi:hypothetical protein
VPFIDLHAASIKAYNEMGPEAAKKTFNRGGNDGTHLSPKGAEAIADLIVAELPRAVPGLAAHLKPGAAAQKATVPAAATAPAGRR